VHLVQLPERIFERGRPVRPVKVVHPDLVRPERFEGGLHLLAELLGRVVSGLERPSLSINPETLQVQLPQKVLGSAKPIYPRRVKYAVPMADKAVHHGLALGQRE